VRHDKIILLVFALVGLTFGLGATLVAEGGPDSGIVNVGAHSLPSGNAELYVWILDQHVYSRQISSIDDFQAYLNLAPVFDKVVGLACSPKAEPVAMRVQQAR
jgi:hypothetical protein